MKHKKFILSALAVVLVASLGVVLNSCASLSPPPPTEPQADITIPKTLLFENTSDVATNLLRAVYYERTVNAHKFYVKTTVNVTNYIEELRSIDSRIGNPFVSRTDTGDIWGLLLIGIDRVSKSVPAKNVIKFGTDDDSTKLIIRTSDSNFEFDALVRLNSSWNNANTRDGLPVVSENGNWLIEFYSSGDIANSPWWKVVSEKKYQGADDDAGSPAEKFVSGSYTIATNEAGDSCRLDQNLSYDPSTGEYVITIPFTVIDYNDIDKIVVFGVQMPGWRPGSAIGAVVKPLGSSKTLVYADSSSTIKGLPVVKLPKSKDESPQLIPGTFPDVLQGIATSVDAKSGAQEVTNSVRLISSVSNASNMIVFTGPQGSSTVSITNWLFYEGTNNQGDHIYTNDIIITYSAESGADFYAPTNYSVSVVAGNGGEASVSVIVEPVINAPASVLFVSGGSPVTINVSVVDGYSVGSSLIASNNNTGNTHTVTLTGGAGSFTVGGSGANLQVSAGDVVTLIYNDSTSGKDITATINIVGEPTGWTLAGTGEYDFWGAKIVAVFYKTNDSNLELLVYFDPLDSGNNIYVLIDNKDRPLNVDASTNMLTGSLTTGWGAFHITNDANIDVDFIAWGWRSGTTFNFSGANRIESDGSGTSVMADVTYVGTNILSPDPNYYFRIPYTAIGANSGDTLKVYVLFGQSGGTPPQGMKSIYPAGISIVDNSDPDYGDYYICAITNENPTNIIVP